MTHKLMIKTHNKTNLKYLCYTQSEGERYDNYKGSGVNWKKHLKKFGDDITTDLIFESENYEEFKEYSIKKSIELDIVDSPNWANLKVEDGTGGDTVSNKRWITDGTTDVYLNKDLSLPDGWKYGRSKCIFNDSEKQKEFNLRVDLEKRGKRIKDAWDNGKFEKRDHSKCGVKGDKNSSKRPEVREKIRISALKQSEERSIRMSMLRRSGVVVPKNPGPKRKSNNG